MHKQAVIVGRFLFLVITVTLYACSSLPIKKPAPPDVSLHSISDFSINSQQQTIDLVLALQNPNSFDLQIEHLDIVASINNVEIAKLRKAETFTLIAEDKTLLDVQLEAQLTKVAAAIFNSLKTQPLTAPNYIVDGFIKIHNWPLKIPFQFNKTLDL